MAQYIDKPALVAKIVKMKNKAYPNSEWNHGYVTSCEKILSLIDTLEVKEVDLEKTINDYFKDWKFDEELDIMVKPNNYSATFDDIKEVAKHFFELGMQISNKAHKGE